MKTAGDREVAVTALVVLCSMLLPGCAWVRSPEPDDTEGTRSASATARAGEESKLPSVGDRLTISGAETSLEADQLTVSFAETVCNGTFDYTVSSDHEVVEVAVTLLSVDATADCETSLDIDLDEPLGDRTLIDAATGDEVPVRAR